MKYGIYYAYWEKEWGGQFLPYVEKCKRLGFDVLEVACGAFYQENDQFFRDLRSAAEDNGMLLSGGYGPRPEHNLASTDETAVEKAFAFYADMFRKMELAGIDRIGGALYSYWPVNFSAPMDKPGDTARSIKRMQHLADMAADHGITLGMESLNRFEGYMINECYECVSYVKAVDRPNVKVMLDTFHMNIEEDSIPNAIREAGALLGHFHVGEANRRCPRPGGRFDWAEIGKALADIHYDGYIVMEPFVTMGGQVGKDISIWRDLSHGATEAELDQDAADSVRFLRSVIG
ncbi:MAG: sugar phosphate isomerase/epimerase [Clostridiales bacterium]|nr:sugar phosphate isomerase/epimerase [Clostridiales bacterium]